MPKFTKIQTVRTIPCHNMCLALDVVNIEFWTRLKIDKTVITLLMHSYERLEQGIRNSNFIRNVKMVVTQWYFNVFITLL